MQSARAAEWCAVLCLHNYASKQLTAVECRVGHVPLI
jgi:hypothetical protein